MIKQTDEFTVWIDGIKDGMTRRRLGRRLERRKPATSVTWLQSVKA